MRIAVLSTIALAGLWVPAHAADEVKPEEIIRKFAAKELEFQQARNNYTYRQTVKMEEVQGGGKWEEVDDIIFTPEGKRIEKVVYAPVISLRQISLSPQDVQDLRNVQPFVLTTPEIPEYDIQYLGKEKLDDVGCYTFSVKPKKMAQGKRYFEGQIWVDDRDLQIVKTYGKGVGLLKKSEDQAFPKFETYREQIDGKYWFPTYTRANDTLHFKNGDNVPIRMIVKYQDYKKYEGRSTIKFGDVVEDGKKEGPADHAALHRDDTSEEEVARLARATIPLMPTKITVNNNGNIRIEGDFEILDPSGAAFGLAGRTVISLCRCGQSANKPFCDGSHNRIGFNDVVTARELPPPKPKL